MKKSSCTAPADEHFKFSTWSMNENVDSWAPLRSIHVLLQSVHSLRGPCLSQHVLVDHWRTFPTRERECREKRFGDLRLYVEKIPTMDRWVVERVFRLEECQWRSANTWTISSSDGCVCQESWSVIERTQSSRRTSLPRTLDMTFASLFRFTWHNEIDERHLRDENAQEHKKSKTCHLNDGTDIIMQVFYFHRLKWRFSSISRMILIFNQKHPMVLMKLSFSSMKPNYLHDYVRSIIENVIFLIFSWKIHHFFLIFVSLGGIVNDVFPFFPPVRY
jgi:hypothetical protein